MYKVRARNLRTRSKVDKTFKGDDRLDAALKKLGLSTLDDFYAGVGYGKFAPKSLVTTLMPEDDLAVKPEGVVTRVVQGEAARTEAQ